MIIYKVRRFAQVLWPAHITHQIGRVYQAALGQPSTLNPTPKERPVCSMIDRCAESNPLLAATGSQGERLVNVQLVKLIDISMEKHPESRYARSKTAEMLSPILREC